MVVVELVESHNSSNPQIYGMLAGNESSETMHPLAIMPKHSTVLNYQIYIAHQLQRYAVFLAVPKL